MSAFDDIPMPLVLCVIGALGLAAVAVHSSDVDSQHKQMTVASKVLPPAKTQTAVRTRSPAPDGLEGLPTEPVFHPEPICRRHYPLDHHMRGVCVRVQEEAKFAAANIRIDDDVGALCTKRNPEDWSQFVVCARQQMAAKLPAGEKSLQPDFDIGRMCQKKWPGNFKMEEYCINQQDKARSEARGRNIDDRIAMHCAAEWPADWNMFLYCVNQQSGAKSRVR